MKTTKNLAILIGLSIAPPLWAQGEFERIIHEILASDAKSMTLYGNHYDLVGTDCHSGATKGETFLRISSNVPSGWAVRVLAPNGAIRMFGLYADEQLTVPNGQFTFYFPNGRMESSGLFQNGLKKGVWLRYNMQGGQLAERVYDGLDTEGMMLKEGLATLASTH